jgi:hypothetical protein
MVLAKRDALQEWAPAIFLEDPRKNDKFNFQVFASRQLLFLRF